MIKKAGKPNGLEREYQTRLALLLKAKKIRAYEMHPEPLEIRELQQTCESKRKGRYLRTILHHYRPDFRVDLLSGTTVMVETKGHPREQDKEKFKAAAYAYPQFVFRMAGKGKKTKAWNVMREYNNLKLEEIAL